MTKPIRFRVAIGDPHSHLVKVEMTIRGTEDDGFVDVAMPVWTPGSYLVREYSRFVRNVRAVNSEGDRRNVVKQDKARWRVDTLTSREIVVSYEVYAHDLNVRFNHVEGDHAFLHGPALFLYPVERLSDEIELIVEVPEGWRVHSGLRRKEGPTPFFEADDFDELFDCPILAGDLEVTEFVAGSVPHRFVWWGAGNYDAERVAEDTRRIVEASASIFGNELPYQSFDFLTLLTEDQYGGLEHRNSTALMYPRHKFAEPGAKEDPDEAYLDFLTLVAHEHFHVWNVKRIRPERLGPFDYQRENYTRDLWTVEGITSYYQWVSLLRAGVIDERRFLGAMGKMMSALQQIPGRRASTLLDASFDAWIKAYRPHPNNRNADVSYYLKGALAAFALDVMIRVDTKGERSLDDVMRHLWFQYSKERGYPEGGYQSIVEEVVGQDVAEFFDVFVRSTQEPDWNDWLENFGLELVVDDDAPRRPYTGFAVDAANVVKYVDDESPAAAGIYPGDVIVAIDRWEALGRVDELVTQLRPGEPVEVHVMRRGQLFDVEITPAPPRPTKWTLRRREGAEPQACRLLDAYFGVATRLEEEE